MNKKEARIIEVGEEGLRWPQTKEMLGIGDPTYIRYMKLVFGGLDTSRGVLIPGRQIKSMKEYVDELRKKGTLPVRRLNIQVIFQFDN